MNAAEEINKIKQTYYWDSSLENLANWIVCALWTEWQTKDTDKEPYLEETADILNLFYPESKG